MKWDEILDIVMRACITEACLQIVVYPLSLKFENRYKSCGRNLSWYSGRVEKEVILGKCHRNNNSTLIACFLMFTSSSVNLRLYFQSYFQVFYFHLPSQRSRTASSPCEAELGKRAKNREMNCEASRLHEESPLTPERIISYENCRFEIWKTILIKKFTNSQAFQHVKVC